MLSPLRQPSSPSVAFPSTEDHGAETTLSSPSPLRRTGQGSPLRLPMPRSGSMALKTPSPSTTPSRQGPPSRTIAILMRSAAKVHRLAIESRIIDAGFEILADRPEQWYTPEDDDFLSEFLAYEPSAANGSDPFQKWSSRLASGAIHVLVLERHNAAATWLDLLGFESESSQDADAGDDNDLDDGLRVGEDGLPIVQNGLRKTYGVDAFYGSPSEQAAEAQIAICFPELARFSPDGDVFADRAASPSLRIKERRVLRDSDASLNARPDVVSTRSNSDASASKQFRARPMPRTTKRASIQPRLSKAAALRMGVAVPEPPRRKVSNDGHAPSEGPVGISGLPRAEVPLPASLRPPTVAPRLNKAASARTKSEGAATISAGTATKMREKKEVDYSNVPGHKRKSVIAVASTAAPVVASRQTRASMGRISAHSASSDAVSPVLSRPAAPRRASSITSLESGASANSAGSVGKATGERERKPVDFSHTPGHKRQSLSLSIASLAAPTVAPRANRASLARTGNGGAERPPSSSGRRSSLSTTVSDKEGKPRGSAADLYANTPGHKRMSLSHNIASLQAPSIVPRSNNAANARIGAQPATKLAGEQPSRPSSSLGAAPRPSSRVGAAPHQDGQVPRNSARPGTSGGGAKRPPPSSFRAPVQASPLRPQSVAI